MIVTAKPPRKRRAPRQPAAIACGVVVTAKRPGKRTVPVRPRHAPDPEAGEKAAAWLRAQLRPPGAG